MLTSLLTLALAQQIATPLPSSTTETTLAAIELPAAPEPDLNPNAVQPVIKAKAAMIVDLETGKTLFQQNAKKPLPVASLGKLMTMAVILKENPLSEVVTVVPEATKIEPAKANLLAYEKITVESLIQAMLVKSANDAALALAYHNSDNLADFAKKMNQAAAHYGLSRSSFVNPMGFDDPQQYSTAQDLAILARQVYRQKIVQNTARLKKLTIASVDGKFTHELTATNNLLDSYLDVLGLKTGTTDLAGQCLIAIIQNAEGRQILTIVLNSPDRFAETKVLADWTFRNISWI